MPDSTNDGPVHSSQLSLAGSAWLGFWQGMVGTLAVTVAIHTRASVRTAQGSSMPKPNFREEAETGIFLPELPGSRERPQLAGHCS